MVVSVGSARAPPVSPGPVLLDGLSRALPSHRSTSDPFRLLSHTTDELLARLGPVDEAGIFGPMGKVSFFYAVFTDH